MLFISLKYSVYMSEGKNDKIKKKIYEPNKCNLKAYTTKKKNK
jgi:hypothetical protein